MDKCFDHKTEDIYMKNKMAVVMAFALCLFSGLPSSKPNNKNIFGGQICSHLKEANYDSHWPCL